MDDGLIDCVAMDVKTVFDEYAAATQSDIAVETLETSIKLILSSGVEHEFRTTAYPPAVTLEGLADIASYLGKAGASKYVVQQFNPAKSLTSEAANVTPYKIPDLEQAVMNCNQFLPTKLR